MAVGYCYTLEQQQNGWWLVRFPEVPEALTEGETEQAAHDSAIDCMMAALAGYVKAGRPIPRPSPSGPASYRAVLSYDRR